MALWNSLPVLRSQSSKEQQNFDGAATRCDSGSKLDFQHVGYRIKMWQIVKVPYFCASKTLVVTGCNYRKLEERAASGELTRESTITEDNWEQELGMPSTLRYRYTVPGTRSVYR
jgi:hypothetical protein